MRKVERMKVWIEKNSKEKKRERKLHILRQWEKDIFFWDTERWKKFSKKREIFLSALFSWEQDGFFFWVTMLYKKERWEEKNRKEWNMKKVSLGFVPIIKCLRADWRIKLKLAKARYNPIEYAITHTHTEKLKII